MVVEKHPKEYAKTSLNHQGLTILKEEIVQPLYETIFALIIENL